MNKDNFVQKCSYPTQISWFSCWVILLRLTQVALPFLVAGVLRAERLTAYIVGFGEHQCAGAERAELVLVSRDDSPVRVRVQLPWRHDVMRPLVAVLYKDRPRRIVLPAAVRAVDNGADNKGNGIASFCYCRYTGPFLTARSSKKLSARCRHLVRPSA